MLKETLARISYFTKSHFWPKTLFKNKKIARELKNSEITKKIII